MNRKGNKENGWIKVRASTGQVITGNSLNNPAAVSCTFHI